MNVHEIFFYGRSSTSFWTAFAIFWPMSHVCGLKQILENKLHPYFSTYNHQAVLFPLFWLFWHIHWGTILQVKLNSKESLKTANKFVNILNNNNKLPKKSLTLTLLTLTCELRPWPLRPLTLTVATLALENTLKMNMLHFDLGQWPLTLTLVTLTLTLVTLTSDHRSWY